MIPFKDRLSLKERKRQSELVLRRHPDRVPIIIEREPKCNNVPAIDRCKYLVPQDYSVSQLLYIVRKRVSLAPEQGLFFFTNSHLITTSSLLSELYNEHKDQDGFLYINYSGENVFGTG